MPTNSSGEGATRGRANKNPASPAKTAKAATPALQLVAKTSDGYELPVIHLRLPERAVNMGFWGILVGSAVAGAIDPPLAVLIGLGVLIARHRKTT